MGTFCAKDFNSNDGDVACRQLGYVDSLEILKASDNPDIPLASNSTPVHTVFSECGKSGCSSALHILCCVCSDLLDPSCTHDDDVVILCQFLPLI